MLFKATRSLGKENRVVFIVVASLFHFVVLLCFIFIIIPGLYISTYNSNQSESFTRENLVFDKLNKRIRILLKSMSYFID